MLMLQALWLTNISDATAMLIWQYGSCILSCFTEVLYSQGIEGRAVIKSCPRYTGYTIQRHLIKGPTYSGVYSKISIFATSFQCYPLLNNLDNRTMPANCDFIVSVSYGFNVSIPMFLWCAIRFYDVLRCVDCWRATTNNTVTISSGGVLYSLVMVFDITLLSSLSG